MIALGINATLALLEEADTTTEADKLDTAPDSGTGAKGTKNSTSTDKLQDTATQPLLADNST